MRRYLAYLKALLRHKWFVFLAGRELGLGIIRLTIHDWDKFGPRMFNAYSHAFYAADGSKHYVESEEFDVTWLRHQNVSKHHWQAWVLMEDSGSVRCLKMPDADMREMLADWQGAGRAYGNPDTKGWYEKTAHARKLHPDTQAWIERQLGIIEEKVVAYA
jgi:hypothetical protein